jgi:hypothetical protein
VIHKRTAHRKFHRNIKHRAAHRHFVVRHRMRARDCR